MSLVTVGGKEGWILLHVTAGGHNAAKASLAAPPPHLLHSPVRRESGSQGPLLHPPSAPVSGSRTGSSPSLNGSGSKRRQRC